MGRGQKKVSDEALLNSYSKRGSIWKVAEDVGLCGQTVHERLVRLGKINKMNIFTDEEKSTLMNEYSSFKSKGKLDDLAKKMGRTKQFICRQARIFGLTNQHSPKPYAEKSGSNPYSKYHARVRVLRGSPHKCEICGEDSHQKQYDWANMNGQYENPSDYKRMCKICHRKYDKNRVMRAHK